MNLRSIGHIGKPQRFFDVSGKPESEKVRICRLEAENKSRQIQAKTDIIELQLEEIAENSLGILAGRRSAKKTNNSDNGIRNIELTEISDIKDHIVITALLHGLTDIEDSYEERMHYKMVCDKSNTGLYIASNLVGSLNHAKSLEKSYFQLERSENGKILVAKVEFSPPGLFELNEVKLDKDLIGHPLNQLARLALSLESLNK